MTVQGEMVSVGEVDSKHGWFVVAAAFLSMFTVFGVAYSFGAFFGPMADEFGADRSATALFFSITTFLYFALGAVTGHLADREGPRRVMLVGIVFMVAGLLLTARVQSIWLGYATYGLGVGVGVACAYVPMVAAVGGWFERQRTTALGVAVAGIGVGTLTISPLNEFLVESYGWRRTYEIWAVASLVLLGIASLGARRPPGQSSEPARFSLTAIRTTPGFGALYVSIMFVSMALFVPFVFMSDYLDEREITGSAGLIVGVIGISSVLGRLGLGRLAASVPARTLYEGSILVMGLSYGLWLFAGSSYAVLLVFAVVLGIAYGGFIALAPAVMADLHGTDGLGAVLGVLYTAAGVGGLLGPPLIGAVIDRSGYGLALACSTTLGVGGYVVLHLDKRSAG